MSYSLRPRGLRHTRPPSQPAQSLSRVRLSETHGLRHTRPPCQPAQSLSRVLLFAQSLSRVRLSETPWTAAHQASLSITTPGACSNPCPSSRWCHPSISSSAVPFSSHLQSFPASGSFPMSQFFASGGQTIGVSASASVLLMNIQN